MKTFKSVGYNTEDLTTKVIFGYYIEGDNGLYTFSTTLEPDEYAVYDIALDISLPYIESTD